MTNLTEIIEQMKNGGTREKQDRRDAARYRYIKQRAILEDLYDLTGHGPSSWDWTVRLETGESKGTNPPANIPDLDTVVDRHMNLDGYIDLPSSPIGVGSPSLGSINRDCLSFVVKASELPFANLPPIIHDFGYRGPRVVSVPTGTQKCGLCHGVIPCGCPAEILPASYPDHLDEKCGICNQPANGHPTYCQGSEYEPTRG